MQTDGEITTILLMVPLLTTIVKLAILSLETEPLYVAKPDGVTQMLHVLKKVTVISLSQTHFLHKRVIINLIYAYTQKVHITF